jgi:hypothetical protein
MKFDVVEIAALIIIFGFTGKLLKTIIEAERTKQEKEAVVAEFDDDKTSDKRRQRLLMRYPQHLIESPDWRYFKQTKEADRAGRSTLKEWIQEWSMTAGCLGYVAFFGFLAWLVYAVVTGKLEVLSIIAGSRHLFDRFAPPLLAGTLVVIILFLAYSIIRRRKP